MVLIVNAIAILSEDRFLARIGWAVQQEPSFGAGQDVGVKARFINLVSAIRLLARSMYYPCVVKVAGWGV